MKLLGIDIDTTTYQEVVEKISSTLVSGDQLKIFTPNPEILLNTHKDEYYKNVVQSGDILLPDGIGIFIAYQVVSFRGPRIFRYILLPWWCLVTVFFEDFLHKQYGQRITGSDLTRDILSLSVQKSIPIIILDRDVEQIVTEGDQQKADNQRKVVPMLESLYPGIDVSLEFVRDGVDLPRDHPCILLCSVGGKDQEIYIDTLMRTDTNILLGIGIGGSIDIITGFREQAPQWMRKAGFEWLYRLIKRPKRHWKRIMNVFAFLKMVVQESSTIPNTKYQVK